MLVDDYRVVLGVVAEQVRGIGDADLGRPTPCEEWDLAALVGHVLGAIRYYGALARDGEVHTRAVVVPVGPGDDIAAMLAADARDGLDAWSTPGVLDRECTMLLGPMRGRDALGIHVADLAVHAWDLGTARGQVVTLPGSIAESALATWQDVLARRDLRGIVFAEEPTAPDGADATTRLVAFCGRRA